MKVFSGKIVRVLLKLGACICIGLGLLGLLLPVVPTTPFLILATVLSYNSSPKLRQWLLEHPIFGSAIQNYLENRSISVTALRNALITLWCGLAVSILLVDSVWVTVALSAVGGFVTFYLLRLKKIE